MLDDQAMAQNILSAINTAQEAAVELNNVLLSGSTETAGTICADLAQLLATLQAVGYEQNQTDKTIQLGGAAESALASLERVDAFSRTNPQRALHKLEFELFPILQTMYGCYYFWACVFPDKDKMQNYLEHERSQLFGNAYIDEAVQSGSYKYDVSIIVTGYNKLEYTKMCVESLLQNIPEGLNYELILVNHGSSDGTKEYFESKNPDKQLDIKVNGSVPWLAFRIVEGKFYLGFSNDVIATPHAIENMLRAMREDERIGFLVPTTPNIANLQTIPSKYSGLEEMKAFAENNNKYDPYRHEMRTRLNNPVSLFRTRDFLSKEGIPYHGLWYTANDGTMSFPDDLISMLFRRRGYKNVLAKDAYCYHFGSVTIKDHVKDKRIDEAEAYNKGRKDFLAAFGIDPWGTGFCYSLPLVSLIECSFDGHIDVLGINCGMGSNSLKIKEMYKEDRHNLDVTLHNTTTEDRFCEDLAGISDVVWKMESLADIFSDEAKTYHHIVLEDPIDGKAHRAAEVYELFGCLIDGGSLFIKVGKDKSSLNRVKRIASKQTFSKDWAKLTK